MQKPPLNPTVEQINKYKNKNFHQIMRDVSRSKRDVYNNDVNGWD